MLGYNSVIRCEEFGYNELIVLVELLTVLDCEVKRVEKEGGAIDARVIYPSVVLLREKYNTSITSFFKIVDYFLIKRLNDLILVERQLPLLPGEKERGTLLYDEVVLEYFDFLVRSTRVPQYFDLLGRMLYPMIHKKPNFEYMFVFLRGYPEIEEVILKAYTQQHPELYPGLYKVRKIDLSSGGSYKIFFECLKQGIFIADGFSIKIYDIDRLNLVKEMESNSRDSSEDYCALSPDGRTLVKDNGKEIYLLDINNGNKLCLLTYQAKGFNAHKPLLKFSPKGNRLAASVKSGDTYFLSYLILMVNIY